MPIKMLVMVKRKPGLSPEEFRAGYENSHSRIAVRLFGHLWLEYRRNYILKAHSFVQGSDSGERASADDVGFDAVSEYVLRDEAALAEMRRIGLENIELIREDEARWFDRPACWVAACDTMVEDLGATVASVQQVASS